MSLRSRDNVQAKCTELVVIRARMSDLLCADSIENIGARDAFPIPLLSMAVACPRNANVHLKAVAS